MGEMKAVKMQFCCHSKKKLSSVNVRNEHKICNMSGASSSCFSVLCIFCIHVNIWNPVTIYDSIWTVYLNLEGFFHFQNIHAEDAHTDQFSTIVHKEL
jgi:hypothetical protein